MNITMIKKAVGYSALFAGGMVCGSALTVGKIVSVVKKGLNGFAKFLAGNNPDNEEIPHTFKFEEEKKTVDTEDIDKLWNAFVDSQTKKEEEKIEEPETKCQPFYYALYMESDYYPEDPGDDDGTQLYSIGIFDTYDEAAAYGLKLLNEYSEYWLEYFVRPHRLNEKTDPLFKDGFRKTSTMPEKEE